MKYALWICLFLSVIASFGWLGQVSDSVGKNAFMIITAIYFSAYCIVDAIEKSRK